MQIHLTGIPLEIKLEVKTTPKEQRENKTKQKPLDEYQLFTTIHKK